MRFQFEKCEWNYIIYTNILCWGKYYTWLKIKGIKRNNGTLLFACKGTGLDVHANKTKYMIMPWVQNAGRVHNL
jgi:hypothetical protein